MSWQIFNKKTGEVLEEVEELVPDGINRLTEYHRGNEEWFNFQLRKKVS